MLSFSKNDLCSHYGPRGWGQPNHWYEYGDGPPLLLLHGYMAHSMAYRRVLAGLSDFHCVVPDLPGHGYDRTYLDPSLAPTVDGLVEWFTRFLDNFEEPVHVVAHSMGAVAVLGVDPAKLASITFVAPGLRIHAPAWMSSRVANLPIWLARLSATEVVMRIYEPFQWRGEAMNAHERAAYLRPLREPDRLKFMISMGASLLEVPDRLPTASQASVDTLIVWGEHDHMLPLADGVELRKRLFGSQMAVVPRAGHAVMEDEPELFVEVLREFLGGL